jgi:hypothetical protein
MADFTTTTLLNSSDRLLGMSGPNAVIHAGADDITLVGVTKAQLQAHTFDLSI